MKNVALLHGLKEQLQKLLFNQKQLLETLEKHNLVPEHDENNNLVIDSKNIEESKRILLGEYDKLEKFEVVLAVVGTMKAGKSTTINAIVGREILPNRNRPMTSLPTLIAHKKGMRNPILYFKTEKINEYIVRLKEHKELTDYVNHKDIKSYDELLTLIFNIKNGKCKFKESYEGEKEIFDFLAELNDLVRVAKIIYDATKNLALKFPFAEYKEVTSLPRIEVEFTELAQQDEQLGNLVLLDTPGPNEANLPELQEILTQQLKRSSAVMLVMDYNQLKSKADNEIREELKKLPKIEKDRLFVLVNKFDQKNANSDDEEMTKKIVVNDLLNNQVYSENVYCIAAQNAFLATRFTNYLAENPEKPKFSEAEWIQDLAEKAFGLGDAQEDWEDASLEKIKKRTVNMLAKSQITLPLTNIIMDSYKNAPKIAMHSALKDVTSIFTDIKNVFNIKGRFTEQVALNDSEIKQIEETIKQLEHNIQTLKKNTEKAKDELGIISNQSVEEFNEAFSSIEEESADYIWSTILKLIKTFQDGKEQELKDQKRWLTLDNNYRQEREKIKRELQDIENSIEKRKGKITLRKSEMESLSKIIEEKNQEINRKLILGIEKTLNNISIGINQKIEKTNSDIVENMQEIQNTFGEEGIEINLSKLDITNIELSGSISINILNVSSTRNETYWHTTNRVTRWFGKFLNTDWGRESYTVTYCDFSLDELKAELKKLSIQGILEPVQKQVKQSLFQFSMQMTRDVEGVELQAEKLKNELVIALKDEQMPSLELKQKRKETLKQISIENKDIQKHIEIVKNSLTSTLESVV